VRAGLVAQVVISSGYVRGPLLTVKSVRDGWVICNWWTEYADFQTSGFPIAAVEGPLAPDDANPQTNGLSQE